MILVVKYVSTYITIDYGHRCLRDITVYVYIVLWHRIRLWLWSQHLIRTPYYHTLCGGVEQL